ncbi:hypothetical protein NEHOM01_2420 [Nematocida homosporus]|uniref:uncharacterized protein n=1 Tax=Nematocida homosporus TaxID=1912981 RepID=UPI0022205E25|nr:uncharacterized protein NEHOM01_2420 [Nematocida homosporus]KAI5187866.1 hypothetical protein NEHOM01_2420 [Nematocida homosporus]
MQNDITVKKHSSPFGLPNLLKEELMNTGLSATDISLLSFEEALQRTGPLTGATLNKTLQTMLKTSWKPEVLLARLELALGPIAPSSASPLLTILNAILGTIDPAIAYSGDLADEESAELLAFLLALRIEAEDKLSKMVAMYVIARLPANPVAVQEVASRFLGALTATPNPADEDAMERHLTLFSGTAKSKTRHREIVTAYVEPLTALVENCQAEVPIWPNVLALYETIGKAALPVDKVRLLGRAVLKTLKSEESLLLACSQYISSMRKKTHELGYAQFFIAALKKPEMSEAAASTLRQLLVYLVSERSFNTSTELCPLGITQLSTELLLPLLADLKPEKINVRTVLPLLKHLIRAHKANKDILAQIGDQITRITNDGKKAVLTSRSLLRNINQAVEPDTNTPKTS